MSRDRLLVIDADVSKRLALWLTERGRAAIAASALDLASNVKDPEVLRALAATYNEEREWVLVTGDDAMPAEHGPVSSRRRPQSPRSTRTTRQTR